MTTTDQPCICGCNPNDPETDGGPEETCPHHGRPYAEWVAMVDEKQARIDELEAEARNAPLDGFEPLAVVRPGEVAVRVDDIAEEIVALWEDADEGRGWTNSTRLAIRAAKAIQAQRDQTTPQATPETLPTETTVRLACPECGEAVEVTVRARTLLGGGETQVQMSVEDGWTPSHTCKPAIPDEPTEPGARWTLDGKRCVRLGFTRDANWFDIDRFGNDAIAWSDCTSHVEGWGE